ncbi:MAG: nitronate monooxygenase, partial [Propionibacteriaceae bacterium]|nr:nitronate monooxygenase [Propionibacteriaceae bacterium]
MRILRDICVASAFERPDVRLALESIRAGAFPLLHLGHDAEAAAAALDELTAQTPEPFGVVIPYDFDPTALAGLPDQVDRAFVPSGWTGPLGAACRVDVVYSFAEATAAIDGGASALALKGCEGCGRVGEESTFVMFLALRDRCAELGVDLYIYGGAGVHTGAAYFALGARGIVLDSQICLMPECTAPRGMKDRLAMLSGTETRLVDSYRFLHWPAGPHVSPEGSQADILPLVGDLDLERNILPLGQDFALASEYLRSYGRLNYLVFAIQEAAYGHLRQAKAQPPLRAGSALAVKLGTTYPIVQGPMARVSDTPAFLAKVAEAGALPCLAVGVTGPEATGQLLADTAVAMTDRPWAAGLLGFIEPTRFQEQCRRVLEMERPPAAVIIAGGRPAQSRRFEASGVTAFLHVPSSNLLDMYLAEGVRSFIFEGRESGGHVGPTSSTVLWERQLQHLLAFEDVANVSVLFAGGIFDTVSAAFVAVMAASLAARGAKVGVQLGTAYLLTEEAVSSGAVTSLYQKLAVEADTTVLLESTKGQETRALPTPFVDHFRAERQRMTEMGADETVKRAILEELNLGRARVASKGIDRPGRHNDVELTTAGA